MLKKVILKGFSLFLSNYLMGFTVFHPQAKSLKNEVFQPIMVNKRKITTKLRHILFKFYYQIPTLSKTTRSTATLTASALLSCHFE